MDYYYSWNGFCNFTKLLKTTGLRVQELHINYSLLN